MPSSSHRVRIAIRADRLSSRGDDHALDVTGLSFTSDIQNRARGLGTMQFAIDKFSTKEATAESIAVNVAINDVHIPGDDDDTETASTESRVQ